MRLRNFFQNNKFRRLITQMLVLVLILGTVVWMVGFKKIEPEDPIVNQHHRLEVEKVPAGYGQASEEEDRTGEGNEEPEEEDEKTAEEDNTEEQSQESSEESGEKQEDSSEAEENPSKKKEDDKGEETSPDGKEDDSDTPGDGNRDDAEELEPPGEEPRDGEETEEPESPEDGGTPESPGDGDGGEDEPESEDPADGPSDDSEPRLVTSLTNCMLTYSQLENDVLPFEAYIVNGEPDMYLRVKIQNSNTARNGDYLTASGRNYQTALAREESNRITIYMRQGSEVMETFTYTIQYVADKADENTPEVGDHPPEITTSLDSWRGEMTNRNYTLLVKARTYNGRVIYPGNILVQMDGETVSYPTGSGVYEYELYFPEPESGEYEDHTITVLAWDDEGNSAYRNYRVMYHHIESGGVIGTAYVYMDMTTVGLGVAAGPYTYEIKQDEPAAYAVQAMLDDYGFRSSYNGTLDDGYYLSRVSQVGLTSHAQVPENLWNKIKKDGLVLTGQKDANSLGEFDYTQGSGWMYSINGSLYPGKSISSYFLSDGDTVYLRFTLAYGKDIGGSSSGYGNLLSYCGKWINGKYIDEHQWSEASVIEEATCTEDGKRAVVCSVCGDQKDSEIIPALDHKYKEVKREPKGSKTEITYQCERCGDRYTEVEDSCASGHKWGDETVFSEPTCTKAGEKGVECAVCGEREARGIIEALGHDFAETERQEPTEDEDGWILYTCTRCGETNREELKQDEMDTNTVAMCHAGNTLIVSTGADACSGAAEWSRWRECGRYFNDNGGNGWNNLAEDTGFRIIGTWRFHFGLDRVSSGTGWPGRAV